MAYYLIFPEKDTTIYSHPDRDKMNAGHDEILELVKEKATTGENHNDRDWETLDNMPC